MCWLMDVKSSRSPGFKYLFNLDIKTVDVFKRFNLLELSFALLVLGLVGSYPSSEPVDAPWLAPTWFFLTTYRFLIHRMFSDSIKKPQITGS